MSEEVRIVMSTNQFATWQMGNGCLAHGRCCGDIDLIITGTDGTSLLHDIHEPALFAARDAEEEFDFFRVRNITATEAVEHVEAAIELATFLSHNAERDRSYDTFRDMLDDLASIKVMANDPGTDWRLPPNNRDGDHSARN